MHFYIHEGVQKVTIHKEVNTTLKKPHLMCSFVTGHEVLRIHIYLFTEPFP